VAVGDDKFGDVFLVVDGWMTLRSEFEDLDPIVTELASNGLGFGIHVIVTPSRWMDMRPAIRDVLGTKLELRLGDPSDSAINRREALNAPTRSSSLKCWAESGRGNLGSTRRRLRP